MTNQAKQNARKYRSTSIVNELTPKQIARIRNFGREQVETNVYELSLELFGLPVTALNIQGAKLFISHLENLS